MGTLMLPVHVRRYWHSITRIHAAKPPHIRWRSWAWALCCSAAALLLLAVLFVPAPGVDAAARSVLWQPLHAGRAALLLAFSLWLAWRAPWRPVTALEEQQGSIIITIISMLLVLCTGLFLLDSNLLRYPLLHISFWSVVLLSCIQVMIAVRRGHVQLAAIFLISAFFLHLTANINEDLALTRVANPFGFALLICCCGLLIRWWAGLLVAVILPLVLAAQELLRAPLVPPNWSDLPVVTVMLLTIAGAIAMYAGRLERLLETQAHQQAALTQSNQELSRALQEATAASGLKTRLVANVSHELRTPLTAVVGYADMLASGMYGEFDADQHAAIQAIQSSSGYLRHLIDDLIDTARLESGQTTLIPARFALLPFLTDTLHACSHHVDSQRVRLVLHADANLPPDVVADRLRLRQVLLNLLVNATKFTQHGTITLEAQPDPRASSPNDPTPPRLVHLTFTVRDTGIGIPADEHDLIFEPFQQGYASRTTSLSGAGLGLAITRQLVTLMGGTISVTSAPDQGSCFTVRLCLALPS